MDAPNPLHGLGAAVGGALAVGRLPPPGRLSLRLGGHAPAARLRPLQLPPPPHRAARHCTRKAPPGGAAGGDAERCTLGVWHRQTSLATLCEDDQSGRARSDSDSGRSD